MRVHERMRNLGAFAMSAIIGLLLAFLLAGPALMADGSDAERIAVIAALGVATLVVAAVAAVVAPRHAYVSGALLAVPVVLISILFGVGDSSAHMPALLLVPTAAGTALIGVILGRRLRGVRPMPPTHS